MDQIPKLCRLIMQGLKVSQQEQRALHLFMLLPDNAEFIMKASTKQSSIMLCYRVYTRQARRSGQYFNHRNDQLGSKKLILTMLQILEGISAFPTQEQNNAYLCLEGQLLATLIDCQQNPQIISNYFMKDIWYQKLCTEVKVHCLLKIISSCLDQLQQIRDKYTPRCQLRYKILSFITKYGFIFIPIITMLTDTISKNIHGFAYIYDSILYLQQAQESFLSIMGQGEQPQILIQKIQTKPYIMQWEIIHFISWVKFYCYYLRVVVSGNHIDNNGNNGNGVCGGIDRMMTILCRAITLTTHIYELSIEHGNENLSKKFRQNVEQLILNQFLIPFLEGYINQQAFTHSEICKLSSEFHVAVLRLLLTSDQLLTCYLTTSPFPLVLEESKSIRSLKSYCNYVITNNYFYFTEFEQCPIGLSLKLMNRVKKVVLAILMKNGDKQQRIIREYEKQLRRVNQLFFENFIVFKLLLNTEINHENEQLYSQGKNWQQFINTTLNDYFTDLVKEGPKYFSDDDDQFIEDTTNRLFLNEQQSQEQDHHGKVNALQQKKSKKKKFQNDSGFQLFSRMISSISFGGLNQINCQCQQNQQQANGDDDDDDQSDYNQRQQSIIFAQMLSILACFKALINSSINSQKRAHLFFEFYQICNQINIPTFSNSCKLKARLCKLYIIHSFVNQCLPTNFVQQGQSSSNTLLYISKECNLDLEQLVLEATNGIAECLQKLSVDQDDDIQITRYGLSILEDLSRRLAQRIYYVKDDQEEDKGKAVKEIYSKNIDMIFETILELEINSTTCFEKMYSVAGILIDLCGIKTLYSLYSKLVDETICLHTEGLYPQNLDLYLAGISGLLSGITRQQIFRIASQVILEDLLVVKSRGILVINDDDRLEYFLNIANELTNFRLYADTQNRLVLLSTELLYDLLVQNLEEGLSIPCYEKISKELYIKMAKLQNLHYLIPLPQKISMHSYPQILEEYFNSITRLESLDGVKQFASLKVQWLISYLEAKIQRNENVFLNISEVSINIRFDNSIKIEKLASLLNIVTGIALQEIIAKMQEAFEAADKIFWSHQNNLLF